MSGGQTRPCTLLNTVDGLLAHAHGVNLDRHAGKALLEARNKKLKLYGIDVGTCLATGAVAVASALTGNPTLGAISGVLGIAGLPNLKDIKTKFKEIAKEDQARRQSPTGLLFRHIERR